MLIQIPLTDFIQEGRKVTKDAERDMGPAEASRCSGSVTSPDIEIEETMDGGGILACVNPNESMVCVEQSRSDLAHGMMERVVKPMAEIYKATDEKEFNTAGYTESI